MVGFAVVLFSIFALVNSAFADFDAIYTVGSGGSTTLKDSFGWNEHPWLYLDLPSSAWAYTVSWWNPNGTSLFYSDFAVTDGVDQVWHTLNNWSAPGGPRQLGLWDIGADYSIAPGYRSTGSTGFTVTPEPLSSVLFLIGGISLAAARLRRRKK